jgi:hypothetical protein
MNRTTENRGLAKKREMVTDPRTGFLFNIAHLRIRIFPRGGDIQT